MRPTASFCAAIRRVAARVGVKALQGEIYDEVRAAIRRCLQRLMWITVMVAEGRWCWTSSWQEPHDWFLTITATGVLYALKRLEQQRAVCGKGVHQGEPCRPRITSHPITYICIIKE